ncbi:hypothetical protein GCM10023200_43710 [Actinomycetospora chlora]|uniref:DUF397 domain-containing protein n=1 Tax=Actinomycetospora chlora TaxID=663608 RepID=A0ABP9C254_9PSEU
MRDDHDYLVSSFCAGGNCVGMAATPDGVELVDLADGAAGRLRVGREAWAAFVAGVKAGEFDLPDGG